MALDRDARPYAIGVALVVAGASTLLLAFVLGPLLIGSFGRSSLLSYAPERVLLGLCGCALAMAGWIFCGSSEKR